jgi:hypothetical protein
MRDARIPAVLGLVACLASSFAGDARAASPPRFPPASVWHQNVAGAPLHPASATMISTLDGLGGWGPAGGVNHRFHIDFSFHVQQIPSIGSVRAPVVEHAFYQDYYLPDCESPGTRVPLPPDAAFEGEAGLDCDNTGNDCHLLLFEQYSGRLYEVYSGDFDGQRIDALCVAVWDTHVVYPPEGRGDHCTSADAAGFPIAPLLVNADEVAAAVPVPDSDLGHAIRFILPNERMASDASLGGSDGKLYVRPATHAGGPSGPAASVPYGVRMRLRTNFDMSGYNAAAQVVLRTMQRQGIVLSDGGNIALTFESDRYTTAKWAGLDIYPQIFWSGSSGNRTPVRVTDFAVVDTGPRIAETYECVRSAVRPLLQDGYE